MNVVVLSGYGLNCEEETFFAFLEAGKVAKTTVRGRVMHVNELLANPKKLLEFNTMAIPGGFSYGDDTGAGNAYALRLIHGLKEQIKEFMERDTLILGVCNGCQILLRMLIPDVALVANNVGRYQCRWVRVKTTCGSPWLEGIDEMYIPVAHGEGKFCASAEVLQRLQDDNCIAMRYVGPNGNFADGAFPHNPNGSMYDIAALTHAKGRALLVMPHPERALFLTQRYDWTEVLAEAKRNGVDVGHYADGYRIFANAVSYFV